jgi:hypothetical protein
MVLVKNSPTIQDVVEKELPSYYKLRSKFYLHQNPLDSNRCHTRRSIKALPDGALDFLFKRLKVVEGCAIAITESPPTLSTTDDKDHLSIPQGIAAMVG